MNSTSPRQQQPNTAAAKGATDTNNQRDTACSVPSEQTTPKPASDTAKASTTTPGTEKVTKDAPAQPADGEKETAKDEATKETKKEEHKKIGNFTVGK